MAATQQDLSSAPTRAVNGTVRHSKFWAVEFYRSAVGKKVVMAVTGLMMIGFVVGHMVGNLKLYMGANDFNHYAEFLRELLVPIVPRTVILWVMRLGLAGALVLHLHSAYSLTRMNHRARPEKYASKRDYVAVNFASRTMRYSGVLVLAYIVIHLADLTWGSANPDFVRGDAYNNLVASFDRPWMAAIYVLANLALGLHLFHGIWSMFQSLGINSPRFNKWRLAAARGLTALIVLGNISFPLAVQFGVVEHDRTERVNVCSHIPERDYGAPCQEVAGK